MAPTRVGRWNFLAPTKDGSWESVPLGQRMPIFERSQTAHWTESDYTVRRGCRAAVAAASGAVSRYPRPGTLLEKQLLAATGSTFIEGYRLALVKAIPDRANSLVLFWGMSTGGSTLYPLAKYYTPDGYLGWGTSTTGLGGGGRPNPQPATSAASMSRTAVRVRERGLDDFEFYTKEIDPQTRAKWWQAAQRNPRFKSTEDPPMQFGASAIAETAMRLWHSDFLPEETRNRGLVAFMQDDVRADLSARGTQEGAGARAQRHQGRGAAAGEGRCQPQGDGALHKEIPGRPHRGPAPLSVHAGQHQDGRHHVDAVYRLRLFRLDEIADKPTHTTYSGETGHSAFGIDTNPHVYMASDGRHLRITQLVSRLLLVGPLIIFE